MTKKVFTESDALELREINATIPFGFTEITQTAFPSDEYVDCSHIKSITLPESVEIIQPQAFYALCIESIIIPKSVSIIGEGAFQGCKKIKEIIIDPDNQYYVVKDGDLYSKDLSLLHTCLSARGKSKHIIPDNVKIIEKNAFSECTSLVNITIPEGVIDIKYKAFLGCWCLHDIIVSKKNNKYTSVNGILFSKDISVLHTYPHSKKELNYNVPESVQIIGDGAFYSAKLTNIKIPEGLYKIGESAFSHCSSITSLSLPDSVAEIGGWAFHWCDKLIEINIPEGVTRIEEGIFSSCKSLESIKTPESVAWIDEYAFYHCESLTSISIPDGVTKINSRTFGHCYNLSGVHIPDSVTEIDYQAFLFCKNLEYITLPKNLKIIGNSAFSSCEKLKSVNIPGTVTAIGWGAFKDCENLEYIRVPATVSEIEESVFLFCPKLTVWCAENSYAHEYCVKNNIKVNYSRKDLNDEEEKRMKQARMDGDIGHFYHTHEYDYDIALEFYLKAVPVFEELYGCLDVDTVAFYDDIGMLYVWKHHCGDKKSLELAYPFLKKALDAYEKTSGASHVYSKKDTPYCNMGAYYFRKGDYDAALDCFRKNLDVLLKKCGDTHDRIDSAYQHIAETYSGKKEYNEAIEQYFTALEIAKRSHGEVSQNAGRIYERIGAIYVICDKYENALNFLQKAVHIYDSNYSWVLHNIEAYEKIGDVHYKLGNIIHALRYYRKPLVKDHDTFGKAFIAQLQERVTEAEERFIELLNDDKIPNNPSFELAYAYLELSKKNRNDSDTAIKYSQKAVELFEGFLKDDFSEYSQSDMFDVYTEIYKNAAELYYENKNYENALECILNAVAIYEKAERKNYDYGYNLWLTGEIYRNMSEFKKADKYFHDSLEIRLEMLLSSDPDIFMSYMSIADLYYQTKKYKKSLEYYRKALEFQEQYNIDCDVEGLNNRIMELEK